MNWLERHLNWTAFFIFFGSIFSFFFFIWISLDCNFIYWGLVLSLGLPCVLLLVLVGIGWLILSALGYGWILYQKNRSHFFLLFLLPGFLAIIGCLIYKVFIFSNLDISDYIIYMNSSAGEIVQSFIPQYIALSTITIFIIGWIILICLRKRTKVYQNIQNPSFDASQNHFPYCIYHPSFKLKRIFLSFAGTTLVISIFSCLFMNFGYLTYHTPESVISEFPRISFEYPANHIEPVYHNWKYRDDKARDFVYKHIDTWNPWYFGTVSNIYISCTEISENMTQYFTSDAVKNSILEEYTNPEEYQQIEYSTIPVGTIAANQLSVCVENVFPEIDGNDIGSHIYIFFNYKGYHWSISYHSWDTYSLSPPPYFIHLLETVKIHDQ